MPDRCSCGADLFLLKMEDGQPLAYESGTGELRVVRYTRGDRVFGKVVSTWKPHALPCELDPEIDDD